MSKKQDPQRRKKKKWPWILAGVVVILVVIVLLFMLLRSPAAPNAQSATVTRGNIVKTVVGRSGSSGIVRRVERR
jgi:flagellar basal body-associated protein FliL